MLDNDEAGYEATRAIELEYSYRVRDFSHNYRVIFGLERLSVRQESRKTEKRSQPSAGN